MNFRPKCIMPKFYIQLTADWSSDGFGAGNWENCQWTALWHIRLMCWKVKHQVDYWDIPICQNWSNCVQFFLTAVSHVERFFIENELHLTHRYGYCTTCPLMSKYTKKPTNLPWTLSLRYRIRVWKSYCNTCRQIFFIQASYVLIATSISHKFNLCSLFLGGKHRIAKQR